MRITNLRVPRGASHEAPLDCNYDLENDFLYDVKWYKDGRQFLRCLPNGEIQEYPVDGVTVIHTAFAHLGSCPLILTHLTPKSGGEYRCEVTTEGPSFKLAVESAKLNIIRSSRRTSTTSTNSTNITNHEKKGTNNNDSLGNTKILFLLYFQN